MHVISLWAAPVLKFVFFTVTRMSLLCANMCLKNTQGAVENLSDIFQQLPGGDYGDIEVQQS